MHRYGACTKLNCKQKSIQDTFTECGIRQKQVYKVGVYKDINDYGLPNPMKQMIWINQYPGCIYIYTGITHSNEWNRWFE
jgi:hypothetical protein